MHEARRSIDRRLRHFQSVGVIPKNVPEALKWFRKAAEQGDAKVQFLLGAIYLNGDGVPEDSTEAAKWFLEAAKQGNVLAQTLLGDTYLKGRKD